MVNVDNPNKLKFFVAGIYIKTAIKERAFIAEGPKEDGEQKGKMARFGTNGDPPSLLDHETLLGIHSGGETGEFVLIFTEEMIQAINELSGAQISII